MKKVLRVRRRTFKDQMLMIIMSENTHQEGKDKQIKRFLKDLKNKLKTSLGKIIMNKSSIF